MAPHYVYVRDEIRAAVREVSRMLGSPSTSGTGRCEKYARESLNSHHLITQRDNIHARAPDMCVNPRGYMMYDSQDCAICSKNRKIVPYHRSARIPRLTVSVHDYGSC